MSNIDFSALNTLEGYKAFLQAYHTQLSEQRSFQPLGLQKALHTAAPVFGFNDWHVMSAALQQPSSETPFDYPDRYTLKNGATHYEYVLAERYDALLEAYKSAGAAKQENDQIHAVIITAIDIDNDTESPRHTDTNVVRNWEKAKEFVGDLAKNKAANNDLDVEFILECDSISLPGSDDVLEDFHDLQASEVLDWIVENNDVDQLCSFVSYLDYGLTQVSTSDHWF